MNPFNLSKGGVENTIYCTCLHFKQWNNSPLFYVLFVACFVKFHFLFLDISFLKRNPNIVDFNIMPCTGVKCKNDHILSKCMQNITSVPSVASVHSLFPFSQRLESSQGTMFSCPLHSVPSGTLMLSVNPSAFI